MGNALEAYAVFLLWKWLCEEDSFDKSFNRLRANSAKDGHRSKNPSLTQLRFNSNEFLWVSCLYFETTLGFIR